MNPWEIYLPLKAEDINADLCGCKPNGFQKDPMWNVGEETSSVFTAEVAARPTCITFQEVWKLINSSMAWRGKKDKRQNVGKMSPSIPNKMNLWLMSIPLSTHCHRQWRPPAKWETKLEMWQAQNAKSVVHVISFYCKSINKHHPKTTD